MNKIAVIGVPSSAGARRTGQDRAPDSFCRAGLMECLRAAGLDVVEFVNLDHVAFVPDPANPKQQNLDRVVDVAQRVAQQVSKTVAAHANAIVLGGDCTITLGVLCGLVEHFPNLGLIYFDGDVDLNTPDTTASGIFDGMVMSHIVGDGAEALTHIGSRYPLMPEENMVLFGYNSDSGWIDPAEMQRLEECSALKYPATQVRGRAPQAAAEALAQLEARVEHVLVHFDVDVIGGRDFPAADVLHDNGLSFDEVMDTLTVFASSRKFVGLVITEFNSERDEDGRLARRLVDALGKALSAAQPSWQ